MNKIVNTAHTRLWKVYKITFESDGYAYVGITNQPIPDRIDAHIRTPVNAELSTRLRKGLAYTYETLHEVTVEGADGDGIRHVYALERQEIAKLEKPINIHGISAEAQRNAKFWGHEQTDDNKARKKRKRTKRDVHPPREGIYQCSICREAKPHTEFYAYRQRFNGLSSRCKKCDNFRRNEQMTSQEVREFIANGGIISEVGIRGNHKYTTEEKQQMVALYKSGLSCQKVAKIVGCSWQIVNYYAKKAGVLRSKSEANYVRYAKEKGND